MNPLKKLVSFFTAAFLTAGLACSAAAHEAKVVKIKGSAEVQLPGRSTSQPLALNTLVPEGASIRTGGDSEVYLEVFPGGIATIGADTNVLVEKLGLEKQGNVITSQEALLDLKKGTIISSLDPSKKAINKYGVRTPKGVASARGTVYAVTVGDNAYTITTTLSGAVIISQVGGPTITIEAGNVSVNGESMTAQQAAGNPQVSAAVTQAVTVATAVLATVASDAATFGSAAAATAAGELNQVLNTIAQSFPDAASAAITAAVAAAPTMAGQIEAMAKATTLNEQMVDEAVGKGRSAPSDPEPDGPVQGDVEGPKTIVDVEPISVHSIQ